MVFSERTSEDGRATPPEDEEASAAVYKSVQTLLEEVMHRPNEKDKRNWRRWIQDTRPPYTWRYIHDPQRMNAEG